MTSSITASARIEVDASGRCTTLRSAPPLTFRETAPGQVHSISTAAGPVGGDCLHIDVSVAPGGALVVRGVAASLVHPGPTGAPSSLDIVVEVGAGGTLRWLPQPTVLIDGCDHTVTTTIRLGAGARLTWYEPVAIGRHGEPSGSLLQRLRVDRDGLPLLRTESVLGPRWPGAAGPAGTDGAVAFATMLAVGEPRRSADDRIEDPSVNTDNFRVSRVQVAEGAELVTALASSFTALAGALPVDPWQDWWHGARVKGMPGPTIPNPCQCPPHRLPHVLQRADVGDGSPNRRSGDAGIR